MTPRDKREVVTLSVRLSPDVVREVRRYAEADTRSLNGQIEWILRDYVERRRQAERETHPP